MKVLTNVGQQEFAGIRKTEHKKYYEILFESGDILKCTVDHLFETLNGPITAKKLTKNDELIHSICGNTFIKSKKLVRRKFIAYDLVNVENGSLYYTNNVLSHNCSFLCSSNTLISGAKIQQLVFEEPIVQQKNLNIYEQPEQGHVYIATVDVAAGLSMDYSVINVIDVTEAPYKQVMVYRNNEIDPSSFSIIVENLSKKYNNAYLIIESNNDGKIVAKELWDCEYENLISTKSDMGNNVIKSGKRSQPGIMMTKQTKRNGCSKLKDLVENDVLLLIDADTLEEASNFIQTKGSFAADAGKHDDIIMTLVMFSWFATTVYFEDITGDNVNKSIRDNREDDEIYSLLGFVGGGDDSDDQIFNNSAQESSFNFW